MSAAKKKAPTFEALVSNLEDVVEQLESEDLSLEDSIEAYQKGVELAKDGHARLKAAELRIEELSKSGAFETSDLEAELEDED